MLAGDAKRASARSWRARAYEDRKVRQVCIDCQAGLQEDDGLRCLECNQRDLDAKARRRDTDEGRAVQRKRQRTYRLRLEKIGRCGRCSAKAVAGKMCKRCRKVATKAQRAYRARKAAGVIVLSTVRRSRAAAENRRQAMSTAIKTYRPIDTPPSARETLVRAMRYMDWTSSSDILDAADCPAFAEGDSAIRDAHTKALSRMVKRGEVERREVSLYRKGRTLEYRLTAKGVASC